jgi:hypothetical protein
MTVTLTGEQLDIHKRIMSIFYPHAMRRREHVIKNKIRFVHYTTAANALSIIRTKRMWMRNTTCMTDYREVQHGLDALNRYLAVAENKAAFDAALNECFPGSADETIGLFNSWWQTTQLNTYIASISEHDDREDLHGRLSMWRAFSGATARVALVLKLPLELGSNMALHASLLPVSYFTDADIAGEMGAVTVRIKENCDFLRKLDRNVFIGNVFAMFTTAVVCLKHEGFHEEREWRVIYEPKRNPSTLIDSSVEVIGGIPQLVYKIPLENNSAAGISGLDPTDLLDRIILGPSQFPWVMYEAFVTTLDAAGVKDAASRVYASQIPVRT